MGVTSLDEAQCEVLRRAIEAQAGRALHQPPVPPIRVTGTATGTVRNPTEAELVEWRAKMKRK